jgi:hypothetical protein
MDCIATIVPNRVTTHRESKTLTDIGGFLIAEGNQCRIVISAQLSKEEKERGRQHLESRLAEIPEGEAAIYLWICDSDIRD